MKAIKRNKAIKKQQCKALASSKQMQPLLIRLFDKKIGRERRAHLEKPRKGVESCEVEIGVRGYVELVSAPAGRPFRCVSDISELRLQDHWDMLVVTSGDARCVVNKVSQEFRYDVQIVPRKNILITLRVKDTTSCAILNYMSNLVDDVLLRKCLYIRDCERLRNMYLSFHHEFISMDHEHEVLNLDSAGTRLQHRHLYLKINVSDKQHIQFKRIPLIGFPAQSVRSSNVIALDSLFACSHYRDVSKQTTRLIHIESRNPPTKILFDVGSSKISIVIVNTKEFHSDVLAEDRSLTLSSLTKENKLWKLAVSQAESSLARIGRLLTKGRTIVVEYERFVQIGKRVIHDYFLYWGKYVSNVKQNMDNQTHLYVRLSHLKAYEPHASKKTLKKRAVYKYSLIPLAYSPNDALMATMTQIANLLSGFQKQFPPTNNQLRTSSNSRTHATVHDGHIVTEPIQRKAPGNVGNTGARGKKVICYNCRGEGHVARQCKEPKRKMDSQYFKDKALLMEAKEKGDVLDAEAEAFLADVECTAPYDQPQALTTTNMFQANHEDAYDSDVDEGPNAAVAFMANLSSTSAANSQVNEVHSNDNPNFDNVDYQLSQEMHQDEHLDSDAETEIDDNTIPYHQYLLDTEAQNVPTVKGIADPSDKVFYDCIFKLIANPTRTDMLSIWDSEEVLVQQVVSMKKMSEKPGHVRPANGFYEKLNALMFVPQQELSREQAYWLPANERASQTSNQTSPVTPFVHKCRPPSQVLASLRNVNAAFLQFEGIIKERTTQKPDYVSEWCFDYAKQFVEQQLVPFYDHFKKHIQAANETFFKEIREFEQIFDELEAEYEQCVLDNKNLTIEKKNLLIKNDCLIAECLEKDICSIVLTSDIVVPPSSNCLCEDIRSACDREHTKVLELEAEVFKQQKMVIESEKRNSHLQKNHIDLQLKFQNYKQCIDTSSASNAIFEINKLRKQLQGKDDTIRNLETQINITRMLNVGSTEGSCDQQALETDRIQLQDMITSLRIQLDGLKVENVSLKRRYDELSQANTHSRTANTKKLSALTAENTKLKAQCDGVKPTSGASKTVPKRAPRNHSSLPVKSANARRVEAHHRTLNKKNRVDSNLLVKHSVSVSKLNNVCAACNKSLVFANHNDCLVMCDDSVNVKPHQTKRFKRQPKKEWKPIKRVWKPISKPVANSKPQWKPTGRHFSLFEKYPLTRIMEPTDMPIELPPSASSSPQITMVVQIVLWYLDSGCSRHMTGDRARLGTVRFGNDEYAAIIGYGDYKLGDTIISRVYYVEGLKHNLFSVGQFCDGGLEVAFRQHSCHIRNYDMVDLLKGSRTTNLYSISLNDMMSASPVCLLTKASSTKSWLWHRRLNHLNFGTSSKNIH
ncbi:retrovirus-related pol polyprotein from transposon TNT 1-94 [Tanacetum coccineum]